jgi:U4/U6.U5 tri-snRNP-associated protein 3
MWDESDKRAAPLPPSRERDYARDTAPRERREGRDARDGRDDKDDDRHRRYRSRSPRESREPRGSGRDRDRGGRDDREGRDYRDSRRRDDRDSRRDRDGERDSGRDRRGYRGEYLQGQITVALQSRSNAFQESGKYSRDGPRDERRRSASPSQEDSRRDLEREKQQGRLAPNDEFKKNRAATPPVSFKVGGSNEAQDHDRMDEDDRTKHQGNSKAKNQEKIEEDPIEDDDEIVVEDDGMAAMQAMMGFGGFGTTHQKKVAGNDISAVRKEKKTEYRQYMNRVGGFNRPLSPPRET